MTDTALDQDQQMLADSARRYLESAYGAATRGRSLAHESGCLPEAWRAFADMGWLAMAVPEAAGGLGAQTLELCLLAEEMGRAAVNEPWVDSGVLAASLLAGAATSALARTWLGGLMDGSLRVAFVAAQPGLAAVHAGGVVSLRGASGLVPGGAGVGAWLVSAPSGEGRQALVWVDVGAPGLDERSCATYDGRRAARLRFDGTPATLVLEDSPAAIVALVDGASRRATLAHCAETVGGMQRAYEITLEYLKTRRQFGRVVASNQVIQHRLVDLFVEIAEARSLTHAAAAALDDAQTDLPIRDRMIAAAAAYVAQAARHNWKECVQLHGAIGMTQEYELSQFVRRIAAAATARGGEPDPLERLAALSLDREEIAP